MSDEITLCPPTAEEAAQALWSACDQSQHHYDGWLAHRRAAGTHLTHLMNAVTTGAGWHTNRNDVAVFYAPGCDLAVSHLEDRRFTLAVHRKDWRDAPYITVQRADELLPTLAAELRHLPEHARASGGSWLVIFAQWLADYVAEIERVRGKREKAP